MAEFSLSVEPSVRRYSGVARALHWAVVALLVVQFVLAWTMPAVHRGTTPETLINLHLSFGLLILLAVILRALWRVAHPPPPDPPMPAWQRVAAHVVHWALYAVLAVIPILGWINASWRGWHITFFWLFDLPHLIASQTAPVQGPLAGGWVGDLHAFIATWILLPLVGLHVLAALYHALVRRDGVLERMLPGRSA